MGPTTLALAQQSPLQNGSFVTDWSSQRLIFSNPGTEQDAWANGTHDRWLKIVNNPRYVLQQLHRHAPAQGPAAEYVDALEKAAQANASAAATQIPPSKDKGKLKRDWSEGILTGAVLPNAFPATFAVNYGQPNCAGDFALYPTGSSGSSSAATIIAYNNLYDTACASFSAPEVYWAYNTTTATTGGAWVAGSPTLSADGTKVAFIENSTTGPYLVVVKWSPLTLTGCSYASGTTTLKCSGGFNGGDVGATVSSSLSGIPPGDTIINFASSTTVHLATAATATKSGATILLTSYTASAPYTFPTASRNIVACLAPCMTVTALTGAAGNTFSSPYYDYASDSLYIGDDQSHLYKFTPVFNGAAAAPTVITLNSTAYYVASPVYDSTSGCVFVGDSQGYLYKVNSGIPGTVCRSSTFSLNVTSALLGNSTTTQLQGIFDAPLVDSTQATIYVFVAYSTQIGSAGPYICVSGSDCLAEFTTSFGTGAEPSNFIQAGEGSPGFPWFDGAFDNVYYSSTNGTGNLYAVSATSGGESDLVRVPLNNNTYSQYNSVGFLAGGTPFATPITEFCNNGANACVASGGQTTQGNDYLFFAGLVSVGSTSGGPTCYATPQGDVGCAMVWQVNDPMGLASEPLADLPITFPDCYGAAAFVIDNASTAPGASNVYFVSMNGNNASGRFARIGPICAPASGNTIQAVQASQN